MELTTRQKILPLLRAINEEVPWQMVLVFIFAASAWFFGGAALPVFSVDNPIFDFIIRRMFAGFIIGVVAFFISGFIVMTIEDKLLPLVRKIRNNYEKEAAKVKKKVLDDVIDDEILR